MATLPPWLDVTPQAFVGAAEAGAKLGEETAKRHQQALEFADQMSLERDRMQQNQALAGADLQMKAQTQKLQLAEFMQRLKQQDLTNQLALDTHQHNKNMDEQKLALDKHYKQQLIDWHTTQTGIQNERYQQQAQLAARKYKAQQEATQRIEAGEDPAQVFLKLGGELGESASGLAQLYKETKAGPMRLPAMVQRFGEEDFLVHPDAKGDYAYTQIRHPTGGGTGHKQEATELYNIIKSLSANVKSGDPNSPEGRRLEAYQQRYDELMGVQLPQAEAAPGAAAPAPEGGGIPGFKLISTRQVSPEGSNTPARVSPEHEEGGTTTAPAATQPGTPAAAPKPEVPEYIKNQLRDIAYGKGLQQKGSLDMLKDIISKTDLLDLLRRGKKYGLNTRLSPDGEIQMDTDEAYGKVVDRQELEKRIFDAAKQQGWK
jgi:hypothetical protein